MWQCFSMVIEHEQSTGRRYEWAVRLRPDAALHPQLAPFMSAVVQAQSRPLLPQVWMQVRE